MDVLYQNISHVADPGNNVLPTAPRQILDGLSNEYITPLETLEAKMNESSVLGLPRSKGDYAVDIDACTVTRRSVAYKYRSS